MKRQRRTPTIGEMKSSKPAARPYSFFYEWDSYHKKYRWWWNQNPGDMFDMVSRPELEIRIMAANALNIRVVDHLPGFCSLGDNCPDHLGYH